MRTDNKAQFSRYICTHAKPASTYWVCCCLYDALGVARAVKFVSSRAHLQGSPGDPSLVASALAAAAAAGGGTVGYSAFLGMQPGSGSFGGILSGDRPRP